MTAEIPPEYQQFVQSMVGSGAFPTETAVVGERCACTRNDWISFAQNSSRPSTVWAEVRE